MEFTITPFDNDYHYPTTPFTKEFKNKEEADLWCKQESWSGYTYFAEEKRDD